VIDWNDLLEITKQLIIDNLRRAHFNKWIVIDVVALNLIAEGLHDNTLG
jgi:hypothetical protein